METAMVMSYTTQVSAGGRTFYQNINGHDSAVFVPDKFHTTPGIDLIIYFHGWNDAYSNIHDYINGPNRTTLRNAVADDGRFALAMPYLEKRSKAGHIVDSTAAFDAYVNAVTDLIFSKGSVDPEFIGPPQVLRRLIIAAHSGGGGALNASILLPSNFIEKVVSVWGLDCFYSDSSARWISWTKAHPLSSLHVYYTDLGIPGKGTMENSKKIASGCGSCSNVKVSSSKVVHDLIPKEYFPTLLKAVP
jgi:fermentation-respiration switch protein FrsA (DUF1100 family)